MMRQYHTAVCFDLDHTLISGPFGIGVWPNLLRELAGKTGLAREDLYRMLLDENERRQGVPGIPAVAAMDWDDIAASVARRLGVALESDVCALAAAHAAQSRVLDDGLAVLRALRAPGRALVVATKGLAKYQQPVLDALGLTPLFDDILTPDVHGALKRDRAFWGDWPQRARLAIMVGDRYDDDIEAPARCGFKTVWRLDDLSDDLRQGDPFDRARRFSYSPEQTVRADAIIASLQELPAVVERLEQAAPGFTA